MNKQIFVACISALLGTALLGAVKPLAIWNGEFPSEVKTNFVRNGVIFVRAGLTFRGQYFRINNTAVCGKFRAESASNMGQSIIANISNIANSSNDRVLFGCSKDVVNTGDDDKYWLMLDKNGKINAETTSSYNNGALSSIASKDDINFDVQHSFGMFITSSAANSYGTLDGVPVHTNNIGFVSDANTLHLGSWKEVGTLESRNKFLNDAYVTYVAIFPNDTSLSLEDFKTWSLNEMTSAETATNVANAVEAADAVLKCGDGVGINLLGGTSKVEGVKRAYALFVQEDSTLEFSDAASLTLAGPVYIATNKTLTLTLPEGAAAASLKAKHFADRNQISYDTGKITVANIGESGGDVEIERPTLGTVVVEGEEVKPLQVVDGKVVFGVNTKPGLWYAVAASSSIDTINGGNLKPATDARQAMGDSMKLTISFPDNETLMFYKVLAATSEDDLKGEEE